jgi:hypothetical protein
MENSKLLKVTPEKPNTWNGHYLARSFERFNLVSMRGDLSSLSAMLGGGKFTEVYFSTKSGNIYKIFQEKDEFGQPSSWVMVSKNTPTKKHSLSDAEMYYGYLKIGEKFLYSFGCYSTDVTEIVCVVSDNIRLNIENAPEATIVQKFNSRLKGNLAVKNITNKF